MKKKTTKAKGARESSRAKLEKMRAKTAKLSKKIRAKKSVHKTVRITDANIEEQRQAVISQGKKFKYPMQFSKKKILKISALIFLVAIFLVAVGIWFLLYQKQSQSNLAYRVTQVLPLAAANVDGENVPYDDYLRRIRADLHYYEFFEKRDFNSSDGAREKAYYAREQLTNAERIAYAKKIAKLRKITVSSADVDTLIEQNKKNDKISDRQLNYTLKNYYDWTINDYREILRGQLFEKKVAFAIDRVAHEKIAQIREKATAKKADFLKIAKENSEDQALKNVNNEVIVKTGESDIYGIANQIQDLKVGEISEILQAKDSSGKYAFALVKLNSRNNNETKYTVVFVKVEQFEKDFAKLQNEGKIREYIKIPEYDKNKQAEN